MHFIRRFLSYIEFTLSSMYRRGGSTDHSELTFRKDNDIEGGVSSREGGKARKKSLRKLLSRDELPDIIQLVSPLDEEINVDKIREYVTCNPGCLTDTDNLGNDSVLHRLIENIQENDNAVSESHKNLLDFLLNKGANVNANNISCETPLHIAARRNKYKTIRMLIEKDAEINKCNNGNNTCLHEAVKNASVEAVAILHLYADRLNEELQNQEGFTALSLAKQIEFNDRKKDMEVICEILSFPAEEYKKIEKYKEYLKKESRDEAWSLRPIFVQNNTIESGGNLFSGQNTININDGSQLLPINAGPALAIKAIEPKNKAS